MEKKTDIDGDEEENDKGSDRDEKSCSDCVDPETSLGVVHEGEGTGREGLNGIELKRKLTQCKERPEEH